MSQRSSYLDHLDRGGSEVSEVGAGQADMKWIWIRVIGRESMKPLTRPMSELRPPELEPPIIYDVVSAASTIKYPTRQQPYDTNTRPCDNATTR